MRRRGSPAVLILLVGAVVGCASIYSPSVRTAAPAEHSSLPVATPGRATASLPTPSSTPAPSASARVAPYPIVQLAPDQIHTISLPVGFSIHRSSASGPRVVFDQSGYGADDKTAGVSIFFADLSDGTLRKLATAANGDAAWTPVISGDNVAWVEWRYADNVHFAGTLTWRIMTLRLPDGEPRELASGVNRRLEGGQAIPPLLSLDGIDIAYTRESPTASDPLGWKIMVVDVATGTVRRSLQTERSVYSLALNGGRLAYSEGLVDQAANFKYKTQLMVWQPGASSAVKIADDAFEVALSDTLVAWVSDALSSQGQSGLAQRPRIYVASLSDLRPLAAGHEPDGIVDWGGLWPSAGDRFATWSDNQDTPSQPDASGDHLVLWDAQLQRAYQIEPSAGVDLSGIGGGWLVWHSEWDPVPVWRGVQLSAITPPAP